MEGNLTDLVAIVQKKAPEYIDLLTSEDDAQFLEAFDVLLEGAVTHLEKNCKNFNSLDEEGLSAVIASYLTMPGLSVTQETNSNGHVDLTIEADHCSPRRTILGEAKIYDGPAHHIQGVAQLLGRYTTGRELRGALFSYVRKKNIAGLIGSVRKRMDEELPEKQTGPTMDHTLMWSFLSEHQHSSGTDIQVEHVGCNLYAD